MTAELRCLVYPGQFSSEFAVVVESFNGRRFSLFSSRDDVSFEQEPTQDEPTQGWLAVQTTQRSGNNIVVRLPQTTIENGQYLSVRLDQVRQAPESIGV